MPAAEAITMAENRLEEHQLVAAMLGREISIEWRADYWSGCQVRETCAADPAAAARIVATAATAVAGAAGAKAERLAGVSVAFAVGCESLELYAALMADKTLRPLLAGHQITEQYSPRFALRAVRELGIARPANHVATAWIGQLTRWCGSRPWNDNFRAEVEQVAIAIRELGGDPNAFRRPLDDGIQLAMIELHETVDTLSALTMVSNICGLPEAVEQTAEEARLLFSRIEQLNNMELTN